MLYVNITGKAGKYFDFVLTKIPLPLALALCLKAFHTLWIAIIGLIIDPYLVEMTRSTNAFVNIPLNNSPLIRALLDTWVRWDAVHFLNIAKVGYEKLGPGDLNYFPLYPFLVRLVYLNGAVDLILASLIISTTAACVSIYLIYQLTYTIFENDILAKWTTLLWAFYPTSFFLFAPYSDSLFAAFTLGCLLALYKKRWVMCGVLASLAGLTRAQGILLVIPITFVFLQTYHDKGIKPAIHALPVLILAPIGWVAYFVWRIGRAGPLFSGYAVHSRRMLTNPFSAFFHAVEQAIQSKSLLPYTEIFSLVLFGLLITLMFASPYFRKQTPLLLFTAAMFGSFIVWDSQVVSVYQSMNRYVISLYPAFIGLAYLLLKFPQGVRRGTLMVSSILLLLSTAGYALWLFVG